MKITVEYHGQTRAAAGRGAEMVQVEAGWKLRDVLAELGRRHGESLRNILLTADGERQAALLVFVGERQVANGSDPALSEGDVVVILSPISGG